jgi:hypothetical protein
MLIGCGTPQVTACYRSGVGATSLPALWRPCGTRFCGLADRFFTVPAVMGIWQSVGVRMPLIRIDDGSRVSILRATAWWARIAQQHAGCGHTLSCRWTCL